MKKILCIAISALMIGSVLFTLSGCNLFGNKAATTTTAKTREVAVQLGNISTDITASGNLDLSDTENLVFEQAGTVDEVNVVVGDSVTKGQVIATLDETALQDQLTTLKNQIITAQRSLLQAQINLINAQVALEKLESPTTTTSFGSAVLQATDTKEIEIQELQVELAQGRVDDAQHSLDQAQEALADADSASPQILAPFDGFITAVNTKGGAVLTKGTVVAVIADPNQFQATILVSEMDIPNVKIGSIATVKPQAFSTVSLPAKVTQIPPTATIQQGVVNYQVTVELQPLTTTAATTPAAGQTLPQQTLPPATTTPAPATGQSVPPATTPGQTGQGTQRQFPSNQGTGTTPQLPQGFGTNRQTVTSTVPTNFKLRDGMTVTVSIIVSQRTNVLLIPNGSISYKSGKATVQVAGSDGTTTERSITIGLADWQNTEVISGLSEGEKVIVSLGTGTSSASTSTTVTPGGQFGGQGIIPGLGIGGR
jgi:HlyD family secretion protein